MNTREQLYKFECVDRTIDIKLQLFYQALHTNIGKYEDLDVVGSSGLYFWFKKKDKDVALFVWYW